MKVGDLMTKEVITIGPDAPLKDGARKMIEGGVSGLVVTDEAGAPIGVVSEADFVKAEADRRATRRAGLLRVLTKDHEIPSSERYIGDVMTSDVVTIGPESDHADAARLMKKERVKRLPVVDDTGSLVGLVSRSDILRAFARSDDDVMNEIVEHVMKDILWIDPRRVEVVCEDGDVVMSGRLETRSDAELLVEFTRRLDGVASVKSNLTFEVDNAKIETMPPMPPNYTTVRW